MRRVLISYLQDFKQLKLYLFISVLLFGLGIYIGAASDVFQQFLNDQIRGLGDIAGELAERDNASMWFFIFIFLNNTIKSILVMYLGGLFVLIPVVFLMVNGMVLGYLFSVAAAAGQDVGMLFIKGILPHGIIELPAIIIACAFGIRFGVLVIQMLAGLFRSRETRAKINSDTKFFVGRTLYMMGFLTIALFVAAVIESTFTFWLMNQ